MLLTEKIKIGDLVEVRYPEHEQTNNPARKLNGQQFVVKRKKVIECNKNSIISRYYFELYGAESNMGVPFGFLEDELIRVQEDRHGKTDN